MTTLQQSPTALRSKSPPSPLIPTVRSTSLRISSFTPSLRLPSLRLRRRRAGPTMSASAATTYASALADLASSTNSLESTSADMEKISKLFFNPSVVSFFANPTIPVEKKRSVISDIASDFTLQPHTANFLNLVLDMGRAELLEDIAKEFEAKYNAATGTETAVVTSVVELDSTHLAQIAKAVQRLTGAKNVRVRTAIDPSLVAGFTVRYGNTGSKLIDMSVKKQLDEIARQLEFNVELVSS